MLGLKSHLFIVLALSLLAGAPARSETPVKRLAVLEFRGADIKSDVLDAFADAVRGGAIEVLAGRGTLVMTRENLLVLLKDMGKKECTEGECEVETARNIGADFVISGTVVRIDDAFAVSLKLHEARNGSLLGTEQAVAKTQLEVLTRLTEQGSRLVLKTIVPRAAPAPAAKPQPAPLPAPIPANASPADPSSDPDKLLKTARDAWLHGQYTTCLDKAQSALRSNPNLVLAWQVVAICSCRLHNVDAAAKAFEKLDNRNKVFVKSACQKNGINL
jgi:hypothetical protein